MTQWLRVLTALSDDLASVPRSHVAVHKHLGDLTNSNGLHIHNKIPIYIKIIWTPGSDPNQSKVILSYHSKFQANLRYIQNLSQEKQNVANVTSILTN